MWTSIVCAGAHEGMRKAHFTVPELKEPTV